MNTKEDNTEHGFDHSHNGEHFHGHHHHDHGNLKGKKLAIAVILNLLITGSQVVGGVISGSLAVE